MCIHWKIRFPSSVNLWPLFRPLRGYHCYHFLEHMCTYNFGIDLLYRVLLFAELGFYLFIKEEFFFPSPRLLKIDLKYLPIDTLAPFSFNPHDNLWYIVFIPGFIEQRIITLSQCHITNKWENRFQQNDYMTMNSMFSKCPKLLLIWLDLVWLDC